MKTHLLEGKPVLQFEYIRFEVGLEAVGGGDVNKRPCVHYRTPGMTGTRWNADEVEAIKRGELTDSLLDLAREQEGLWEGHAKALKEWNHGQV